MALLSAIGSIGTFLAALVALIFGASQLRQMERDKASELRPYVSARYLLSKGKSEAAILQLHNSGRTSARNIQLTFPANRAWHYLKSPNLAFATSSLSIINPGETIEFFMGKVIEETEFAKLKSLPMDVQVSCESGVTKKKLDDTFTVSLSDHLYSTDFSSRRRESSEEFNED